MTGAASRLSFFHNNHPILHKTNFSVNRKLDQEIPNCYESAHLMSLLQNEDFRPKSRHAKNFTAGI